MELFSYPLRTKLLAILLPLLLVQCKNKLLTPDSLPDDQNIVFQDQSIEIGQGEAILLDVKELVEVNRDLTVRVMNADDLSDRFVLTDDGLLAYLAPEDVEAEAIEIEIADDFGNTAAGILEMQIKAEAVIEYCSPDDLVVLKENQINVPIPEILAANGNCNWSTTDDFEIIFPPKYLEVSVEEGRLIIQPNLDAPGKDVLFYRGNRIDPSAPFLDIFIIHNQKDCTEAGIQDDLRFKYEDSESIYQLDVLENDEFCSFTKQDAEIISLSTLEFGSASIVEGQYIEYIPPPNPTLPFVEIFSYTANYKTAVGTRTQSVLCRVTLTP